MRVALKMITGMQERRIKTRKYLLLCLFIRTFVSILQIQHLANVFKFISWITCQSDGFQN